MRARTIRFHIIMAILTPIIWVGCMVLLGSVYMFHWITLAYQQVKHRRGDLLIVAFTLAMLVMLQQVAALPPQTEQTCDSRYTEWECNGSYFSTYLRIATALLFVAVSSFVTACGLLILHFINIVRAHIASVTAPSPQLAITAPITIIDGGVRYDLASSEVMVLQ